MLLCSGQSATIISQPLQYAAALFMKSHLTGSAMLDQGSDNHTFTGMVLTEAKPQTGMILERYGDPMTVFKAEDKLKAVSITAVKV